MQGQIGNPGRPAPCSVLRSRFRVLAAETNDSLLRFISEKTEFGLQSAWNHNYFTVGQVLDLVPPAFAETAESKMGQEISLDYSAFNTKRMGMRMR